MPKPPISNPAAKRSINKLAEALTKRLDVIITLRLKREFGYWEIKVAISYDLLSP